MSDQITITVEGSGEWRTAMDRKIKAIHGAMSEAVSEGMTIVHREIAAQLNLTSHPVGTPRPEEFGLLPPSHVTGNMIRSIDEYGPYYETANRVVGLVGPGAVQSRIQELGGDTGRNHATHLPARPYVRPAVEIARPQIAESHLRVFSDAVEL